MSAILEPVWGTTWVCTYKRLASDDSETECIRINGLLDQHGEPEFRMQKVLEHAHKKLKMEVFILGCNFLGYSQT